MPPMTVPAAALATFRALHDAGHETYFCGGCVRDHLMGRSPKDWDITTSATPDAIEALFPHTIPVGKAFGVMIVVQGEAQFEVATFRTDLPYADGRHPEGVRFATATEDVKRRDFTINALLYDPEADRVIDHVGGCADIEKGVLRTVGDPRQRFGEDHLRLLRAVRFAGRTGFALEEETQRAMQEMASLVRTVSSERVGEEVQRMLTEGYASAAVSMLEASSLLLHVLPEVAAMRGVPQPARFHPEGDVLTHTLAMLELMDACVRGDFTQAFARGERPDLGLHATDRERGMRPGEMSEAERQEAITQTWASLDEAARVVLAFAVLLHDVGKPATISYADRIRFHEHDRLGADIARETLARLKRPRRVSDAVAEIIGRHIHFANLRRMRQSKRRRWLQEPAFPLHLEMHRLDCEGSHRMLENYAFGFAAWQEEKSRPPVPEPLLTGRDLLAMGYRPGPRMGEMLAAVEDARLEGEISTAAEAQAFVRARYDAADGSDRGR